MPGPVMKGIAGLSTCGAGQGAVGRRYVVMLSETQPVAMQQDV
ncbi:hypothetical protein AB28_0829 [Raoultella ornithinolytica 2-156-04_S1_C2]|nr:hypothetical protein AB28_0829 [Raoultella ornithinolytica 2-156-04_S1_C2]